MKLAAPSQLTGVDETIKQEGPSVNCSVPMVIVLSVDVPSPTAVQAPLTRRSPVTGADVQPAPTNEGSRLPLTSRQEDVTIQVPTRSPPQAVTFEQDAPAPPAPEIPPALTTPPLPDFPPVPDEAPEPELHAIEISPGPTAVASTKSRRCFFAIFTNCRPVPFRVTERSGRRIVGDCYGVPTNVVTLCELSVTVTRDCATPMAEPWPRLLLADVS
jgi:hypothetical protein